MLLGIFDGITKKDVRKLIDTIHGLTGTPQNPVDWSDPDSWIDERLSGGNAALAHRIWKETEWTVNPRHIYGDYMFVNSYELLTPDATGIYRLTDRGKDFLAGDESSVVREIDDLEGIPKLLEILSTKTSARKADLIGEWSEFLAENSKWSTPKGIADTMRRRLNNLIGRGYVSRTGNAYQITPAGITYLGEHAGGAASEKISMRKTISDYNGNRLEEFRSRLISMDPYAFEALVGSLLEAMDYEDVVVTKQSGDKGVDVVARYQFGITEITEVVQVKRQQGTITRPILDQLRGALHYHNAIRGTIITLGKFAKGTKDAAIHPGAPPITLIDGDKLIELLVKHGIGIKKRQEVLLEVDEAFFKDAEEEPMSEDD
ncbi:restriction endonuclease [Magnetospira sp. QH-2]|uniref:restriction endonuclease n=1 Tax=Magnetospira sp. (strain QH-2) TaxID=1288970 RepID=UPI0018E0875C|nr:restriction endonuclease [Magnetospira sp. QH-2]